MKNPSQICYSTPGQYTVTLIASNSVYSDTTTIINYINVNPIPQLGLPGHSNDTMFMSGGYVSFQWYMNSQIIPGATDSFYVATQDGLYYVEVVDSNGCQGTSAYLDLAVGIASLQTTHEFRLFPNPVKNDFTLKFNSDKSQYISIEVRDVVGQLIYSDQYSALPPIKLHSHSFLRLGRRNILSEKFNSKRIWLSKTGNSKISRHCSFLIINSKKYVHFENVFFNLLSFAGNWILTNQSFRCGTIICGDSSSRTDDLPVWMGRSKKSFRCGTIICGAYRVEPMTFPERDAQKNRSVMER